MIIISSDTLFSQEILKDKGLNAFDNVKYYISSKPLTRWWWFASVIDSSSVRDNLNWLKNNGFGGVEIAWVYPLNRMQKDTINYTPRQEWLSSEWSQIVSYAKTFADSLGLTCDFTFGTLWPFGDSRVPFNEATMNFLDSAWRQEITASWEYPKKGYVIDHLNRNAFYNYARRIGNALTPALKGSMSGIFCDSWEVETKYLSTYGFLDTFKARYDYSLSSFSDSLYSDNEKYYPVRYDYMKLLSEFVIREFYKPYVNHINQLGAFSRVQCSGAPCDLISAYSLIDVPESEALLFEPSFSKIVLSAAALSGKRTISSETFTCLYGWPDIRLGEEQTADLKLLADALFANGVNQIIWHGKPFNPSGIDTVKFYASVHVGSSGSLSEEIPLFNSYMEKVSAFMKKGIPYSDVAVYLPTEDSWVAGEMPVDKQFIWAWGEYEHRYTVFPEELKGYSPLWINGEFLSKSKYENGFMYVGDCAFKALYIDVKWMDVETLETITRLAKKGLPVCLIKIPEQPGSQKSTVLYKSLIDELVSFPNVKREWKFFDNITPLIYGKDIPDFQCRQTDNFLYIFFANPLTKTISFPFEYGQSYNDKTIEKNMVVEFDNYSIPLTLDFEPYQSILVKIDGNRNVSYEDIKFIPKTPDVIPREKPQKERWKVK